LARYFNTFANVYHMRRKFSVCGKIVGPVRLMSGAAGAPKPARYATASGGASDLDVAECR